MEWSAAQDSYVDPAHPDMPQPKQPLASHAVLWRAVLFFSIFAALQVTWNISKGSIVEKVIVHDATVVPAAWLVNLITPEVQARAVEFSVQAPGGGLNILNGCEGMDAVFLLIAAFLVAPIPWRSRLFGLLLGLPIIYVINQARILALFYAYRTDHRLFDPLHGTVAPIIVVLLVLAYFYTWLMYAERHHKNTP